MPNNSIYSETINLSVYSIRSVDINKMFFLFLSRLDDDDMINWPKR